MNDTLSQHGRDLARVAERYAVSITPAMERLIDPNDPADPIARQFRPNVAELVTTPEESADPIGDEAHSPVKGIVHRYPDRCLLKVVHVCPVYCRFCFRREMVGPGSAQALTSGELQSALDYIAGDDSIWEVILTGGDPFVLSPRRIANITSALAHTGHVKVVRWHTRVPVVDPDRVSARFAAALRHPNLATFVVLHANHARELTGSAREACRRIIDAGVPMLSQSVLLRGVNDDVAALESLLRALVETRIKPYYLHHADLAPGTGHFRTSIDEGQDLMRALRGRVSGLCQPAYVLDIPGGHGKVPIGPNYLARSEDCAVSIVQDIRGNTHRYPPK
jgi:lysine 2,3-aminomutase